MKPLNVKLIDYKTYGNSIWIKRIKTGENYAEATIAMSENISSSSTAKLPNCQYNKSSIKTRNICDKHDYLLLYSCVDTVTQIVTKFPNCYTSVMKKILI